MSTEDDLANELLDLIGQYQETVEALVRELRSEAGTHDLLRAVAEGRLARTGQLSSGCIYHFHGVGCQMETPAISVDIDFGPGGLASGFDAWRLWQYAAQLPASARFGELSSVEQALEDLRRAGKVHSPGLQPSPHLFYLTAPS